MCEHTWVESYYGHDCTKCGAFYPHGGAPWDDIGEDDYDPESWDDDEDYFDCGWVRGIGCTKAGSEECDWECPHRAAFEKGMRLTQARLAKRAQQEETQR